MTPVPHSAVAIDDGFWAPRLRINRQQTLPTQYRRCQETGQFDAFRGRAKAAPHPFWDSDVAKWIEAASYSLATHPDRKLARQLDRVVDLVISAQQPDGYLNTAMRPGQRWKNLRDNHELYCAGHLIEAAVAHYDTTGQRKLLDALCRYADLIGTIPGYCGHPEIELALLKLHRATGQTRYRSLAREFLDRRGQQPHYFDSEARARGEDPRDWNHPDYSYCQAHLPVRQQTQVTGHAVRAMYLYSAMAELGYPCAALWNHLVTRHLYVTGGIGPWKHNEGFGADFDLPHTGYCETCAAIGLVFWAHRLLQRTCDRRYADVLERALYNGVLSGVSLDGTKFFYENPLASTGQHHRQTWFGCACCPPNIARLLASLGGYIYSEDAGDVAVHLYAQSRAELPGLVLRQETDYPWDGRVTLHVTPEQPARFTIKLRVPAWCRKTTLRVNGQRVPLRLQRGYALVTRRWSAGDRVELNLAMPVERVHSDPRIRYNRDRVALQRGPVVYCLEAADNGPGLDKFVLPARTRITTRWEARELGGYVSLRGRSFKAIPYALWDNRAPGEMQVWVRESV